jgi:tetratricopeptide (TPR) repeat protein
MRLAAVKEGLTPKDWRTLIEDLSVEERLTLGAAFLRLHRFADAVEVIQVIEAQSPQQRRNFLLLATLATAQQLNDNEKVAAGYSKRALKYWPERWSELTPEQRLSLDVLLGWSEQDFNWYRRAETYYKKLLDFRVAQGDKKNRLDELFDSEGKSAPIQLVGESGSYEPGKLRASERQKLPDDALRLVEQLLLWNPQDARLLWLFGELLNANGDPKSALDVFNRIPNELNKYPELQEHKLILQPEAATQPRAAEPTVQNKEPPPATNPSTTSPDSPSNPPPMNMAQALAVGFVIGMAVAFLLYWQVQEIRRRSGMRQRG